ncbi:D-alanine--D-alanine ligase [Robertkochia flava]|uniref:D-alanine--D-alanine ligase n=1 Tax=Robertkochia flava TaxID=3447986 RepID=UPI001CD0399C|nr:D-alanine--D-alanine ligase [Robertkochia marina]
MTKKNIGVIMGGYTSEFQISLKSGQVVCDTLNKEHYRVFPLHLLKDKWTGFLEDGTELDIDRSDFSLNAEGEKITFDCIFNAIHGSPGENGYIQAYLELLGIPQTSCGMYQSALTYNKRDCLSVLRSYGIKTAGYYYLNLGDPIDTEAIIEKVGLPCFVKANKAGSSFGISKVSDKNDLLKAIEVSFREDDEILIESFLEGTEVSVGVITYRGEVKVMPVTEIVTENDFFDYEAKYQGKSQEITPARISHEEEARVKEVAERVYRILRMKGFSRSEFIFVNGEPHLLEINTVPGLTRESILPQQARVEGISLSDLFESAIEEALRG